MRLAFFILELATPKPSSFDNLVPDIEQGRYSTYEVNSITRLSHLMEADSCQRQRKPIDEGQGETIDLVEFICTGVERIDTRFYDYFLSTSFLLRFTGKWGHTSRWRDRQVWDAME